MHADHHRDNNSPEMDCQINYEVNCKKRIIELSDKNLRVDKIPDLNDWLLVDYNDECLLSA